LACQASQVRSSCGVEEAGRRRVLQVRLGQPPAAFRPRVGQYRGGVQVLDPLGPATDCPDPAIVAVDLAQVAAVIDRIAADVDELARARRSPSHLLARCLFRVYLVWPEQEMLPRRRPPRPAVASSGYQGPDKRVGVTAWDSYSYGEPPTLI
jgi:hypothetical protein